MNTAATNLKKILVQLDISNITLAKAINVDPSLISRWLNGQRQIKLSSEAADNLTDFLINKVQLMNHTEWLKSQMEYECRHRVSGCLRVPGGNGRIRQLSAMGAEFPCDHP